MNDVIKQQVAATVVDAFINMLFSTDTKAAAQKQQMMEELARRKAEAERQHKIEEAIRLDAISKRLTATLKLNGLPGLKLKEDGSSSGGLRLKLGDGNSEPARIHGLPGIALNDTTGNGGNTPFGIKGLPGIYTNGPGSGSTSLTSESKLQLKVGDGDAPATPAATDQGSGAVDPRNMSPDQLADLATQVGDLPIEEQQRLMNAAQQGAAEPNPSPASAGVSTAAIANSSEQPVATQLQQVANASQSAASATNLEDAASKAGVGFDRPAAGTLGKSNSVAVPSSDTVVPTPASSQTTIATTNGQVQGGSGSSLNTPMPITSLPSPSTGAGKKVDLSVLGAAPSDNGEPVSEGKLASWSACTDPTIQHVTLTSGQRAFLNTQMQAAHDRQVYISTALKNLIKLNTAQRAEIEKTTADITKAYGESVDRAWEAASDLLTSLPADKFADNYKIASDEIDYAITAKMGLKKTSLDAAALQRVDKELSELYANKYHLDVVYKRSVNLLEGFKAASSVKDVDTWNSEDKGKADGATKGWLLIGKLMLDHPKVESLFERMVAANPKLEQRLLIDQKMTAKFWQVVAMGKMTAYAFGFAEDILKQQVVWEPLSRDLQSNLAANTQGMELLGKKAGETTREIGCLRVALQ